MRAFKNINNFTCNLDEFICNFGDDEISHAIKFINKWRGVIALSFQVNKQFRNYFKVPRCTSQVNWICFNDQIRYF